MQPITVTGAGMSAEYGHIKQEVIDCLIATRSTYEPDSAGVEEVLKRKNYELNTNDLDLVLRSEESASSAKDQAFVLVRSSAGYIIVACRGTFSLSDVVTDATIAKVSPPFGKGKAHKGFLDRAMTMPFQLFISLLRAGEKIVFTGHSLGGAVASLTALRVLEAMACVPRHLAMGMEQVRCITFGTAAFANLELAAYVNSNYMNSFFHVVSKHDLVPRVHHIAPNVFFPFAKWLVKFLSSQWEVRACKSMIENLTKMSVDKAVLKVEEKAPGLWPVTRLYRFVNECAAYNEDAISMSHAGRLLLLNPDCRDPEQSLVMDEMESLGTTFGLEDKSPCEIFLEHGLANHYSCLVRSFRKIASCAESDPNLTHSEASPRCSFEIMNIAAIPDTRCCGSDSQDSAELMNRTSISDAMPNSGLDSRENSELMIVTTHPGRQRYRFDSQQISEPNNATQNFGSESQYRFVNLMTFKQHVRKPSSNACLRALNRFALRITGNEIP